MARASVVVTLRGGRATGLLQRFTPGSALSGRVEIVPDHDLQCDALLARLRWHTEGRGERDEQVIAEQRLFQGALGARVPIFHQFSFALPETPWSYQGQHLQIVWTVTIVVVLPLARDLCHSQPFLLRPG